MTQGATLAGARAAFAAYPPHIGYNPATRELEQYVPLDRHSYAFFNGEADDEYVIQIEVVGFSETAHLMPDWQVQNIVDDVVNPLEELIGVPPVVVWHGFHGEGEGFVLASVHSPIRLTLAQLREFAGHLGHQHIPGDAHWDPGRFRIGEVLHRSQLPTISLEEINMANIFAAEVTTGPVTTPNIPVGFAVVIDVQNKQAWYVDDPQSLRTACANSNTLHIGVSGERMADLLTKYPN